MKDTTILFYNRAGMIVHNSIAEKAKLDGFLTGNNINSEEAFWEIFRANSSLTIFQCQAHLNKN